MKEPPQGAWEVYARWSTSARTVAELATEKGGCVTSVWANWRVRLDDELYLYPFRGCHAGGTQRVRRGRVMISIDRPPQPTFSPESSAGDTSARRSLPRIPKHPHILAMATKRKDRSQCGVRPHAVHFVISGVISRTRCHLLAIILRRVLIMFVEFCL